MPFMIALGKELAALLLSFLRRFLLRLGFLNKKLFQLRRNNIFLAREIVGSSRCVGHFKTQEVITVQGLSRIELL